MEENVTELVHKNKFKNLYVVTPPLFSESQDVSHEIVAPYPTLIHQDLLSNGHRRLTNSNPICLVLQLFPE